MSVLSFLARQIQSLNENDDNICALSEEKKSNKMYDILAQNTFGIYYYTLIMLPYHTIAVIFSVGAISTNSALFLFSVSRVTKTHQYFT